MKVKIKLFDGGRMPMFQRAGDACADCYARIYGGSIKIPAHSRYLVSLGVALELPEGYEAVIRPRSGLSLKGIDECIGTIDSNYRGEIKACIVNNTDSAFHVKDGDRICQLAIRKTESIEFVECAELSETVRGDSGFGSSGVNDDWYVFKSKDGFKITKELGGAYCHFSGTKEECQKWIENKEQGK